MQDSCGYVEIKCKKNKLKKVKESLLNNLSLLYGGASNTDIDESNKKAIKEIVESTILQIKETEDGLFAEIMDIQSGCFLLADKILGNNSYVDQYGYNEDLTFGGALTSILLENPDIVLNADIEVSNPYSGSVFEKYHTENGALIFEPAFKCEICGKLFTPSNGFFFPKGADEYIEEEGSYGICSKQCAETLINNESTYEDLFVISQIKEIKKLFNKPKKTQSKKDSFDMNAFVNGLPRVLCLKDTCTKIVKNITDSHKKFAKEDIGDLRDKNDEPYYDNSFLLIAKDYNYACIWTSPNKPIKQELKNAGMKGTAYLDAVMIVYPLIDNMVDTANMSAAKGVVHFTYEKESFCKDALVKDVIDDLYLSVNGINKLIETKSLAEMLGKMDQSHALEVMFDGKKYSYKEVEY